MIRLYSIGKTLYPKHVFRISRATRLQVDNVFLVLEQDGMVGFGEASPNAFFQENHSDVQMGLAGLSDYFRRQTLNSIQDIERIWHEVWEHIAPSRACQCAIDIALWDLWSKLNGQTVIESAIGKPAKSIPTSATLGICPPAEWGDRISELADFPAIKIKVDASVNLDLIQKIRSSSKAAIRVDANCAWQGLDIPDVSEQLKSLGVEFIEQPLYPSQDNLMEAVLANSCLPIFADESCASLADLEFLQGKFSGINIKLVKCGGITPALKMLRRARELHLKIMIGCMLESTLLISAGTVVAQEADYADLDGSWLLREDCFEGLALKAGKLCPNSLPGLGVKPKLPPD